MDNVQLYCYTYILPTKERQEVYEIRMQSVLSSSFNFQKNMPNFNNNLCKHYAMGGTIMCNSNRKMHALTRVTLVTLTLVFLK